MKREAQPFVTVPFILPNRIELATGAKVSVKARIDGQDYCHALTIEARRAGQLKVKVVDPAGDLFDLVLDQIKGTVSLIEPLPMPKAWAAMLAKRLAEIVIALLAQFALTARSDEPIYGT